jgi:hypothetical protein
MGPPISSSELMHLDEHIKENDMVILIVGSCLTTGNKFNSISRELRNFRNSSLHYFTVFSRLSSKRKHQILKNNLIYRTPNSKYLNKYHEMYSGFLGDYHDKLSAKFNKPPWSNEIEFWKKSKITLPEFLLKRMEILKVRNGLENDLFFINPFTKTHLSLRPNFAFHKFDKDPSQADVYFIMSSIIHFARFPEDQVESKRVKSNIKYLRYHEHCKSVFSPECFNRYNDGIIQASILRIAHPNELNYSIDERFSFSMMNVIKDIFKDETNSERCEAILEFLYAIVSGKLRLVNRHKSELLDHFENSFKNEEVQFFVSLGKSNKLF